MELVPEEVLPGGRSGAGQSQRSSHSERKPEPSATQRKESRANEVQQEESESNHRGSGLF